MLVLSLQRLNGRIGIVGCRLTATDLKWCPLRPTCQPEKIVTPVGFEGVLAQGHVRLLQGHRSARAAGSPPNGVLLV